MNLDDFRYMRRGEQLRGLTQEELPMLAGIDKRGSGREKALLFLHGFASTPAVYRHLLPKIKGYDALVSLPLAGHAQSLEAFSTTKASAWVGEALAIFDDLAKHYKKVDVLGLSLGGLIACYISQSRSINHLFLLAPALKLQMRVNFSIKLGMVLRYLGFHHLRNAAGNLVSAEHGEIALRKLPITSVIEMLGLVQDYQWQPPKCPVDLFLGDEDKVVASKELEQMFLPLPNVHIHWLHNSAHVLPLDNDMDEIVRCVNQETSQ